MTDFTFLNLDLYDTGTQTIVIPNVGNGTPLPPWNVLNLTVPLAVNATFNLTTSAPSGDPAHGPFPVTYLGTNASGDLLFTGNLPIVGPGFVNFLLTNQ